MKKFFLGTVLSGKKLDRVDEQRSGVRAALLEHFDSIAPQSVDHFADELLGSHVNDPGVWVTFMDQVAGSVQKVCFSQPRTAVNYQWVVG